MKTKENDRSTPDKQYTVLVCQGTGCTSSKSEQIRLTLEDEVTKAGLTNAKVDFT